MIRKAPHANMFLARHAGEVMDKDLLVLRDDLSFDALLRLPEHGGRMRHVVTLGELAGTEEVMFDVIGRMVRERAPMVIVFNGPDHHARVVGGLITKEHLADSVSESIGPYASGDGSSS